MLQWEHSAILSAFIKLPFVSKIFVFLLLSGRLRQVLLYSIVLLAGLMQSLRPHVFPEEYSQMSDFAWKRYNVYFTDAMDDY